MTVAPTSVWYIRCPASMLSIAAIAHFKDFLLEWDFLYADFDVAGRVYARPLEAASRRHAA